MAAPLAILTSVARAAKVPIKNLTLKMIQNAPMPVRFKKYLQGQTIGEAMIAPSVGSQRAVVPYELKALGVGLGGGAAIGGIIAKNLYKRKNEAEKIKSKGPKKRDDKAMKKSLDDKAAIERKTSILNPTAKKFKTDQQIKRGVKKALKEANTNKPKNKPKKRPANMNKGGMVNDMRKSGLFR